MHATFPEPDSPLTKICLWEGYPCAPGSPVPSDVVLYTTLQLGSGMWGSRVIVISSYRVQGGSNTGVRGHII